MTAPRQSAIEWKKDSIAQLRRTLALLRELRKYLSKACDGVKATVDHVADQGERVAREYDRSLDEESEDYGRDADAMSALQEIPGIDDEVEDAKLQAGESIDGLIGLLDEVLSTVQAVKP